MISKFFLNFFKNSKLVSIDYLFSHKRDFFLVDLRSREAFFDSHIVLDINSEVINVPLEHFSGIWNCLLRFKRKRLLLYGASSKKILGVKSFLEKKGFNIFILKGGFAAYKKRMYV